MGKLQDFLKKTNIWFFKDPIIDQSEFVKITPTSKYYTKIKSRNVNFFLP
jgi:hypothetical protein